MRRVILFLAILPIIMFAQAKDKGVFENKKSDKYKDILESIGKIDKYHPEDKAFKVDVEGMELPKTKNEFKTYWHNEPVSQGYTGTCWAFSTTSFFESEIYRLTKKEVKLSQLFFVYWEYVAKTDKHVWTKGESLFAEGSEANALQRLLSKYGCVPREVYTGKPENQKYHDHSEMFKEMEAVFAKAKENDSWELDTVLNEIKSIMDKYMGTPPEKFTYKGKEYTPESFMTEYCKLNPEDYVDILSIKEQPYMQEVEYTVPDNWWHDSSYVNVPLNKFMDIINNAIESGYTMSIGGDVSEPGKVNKVDCLMIPDFDIPSAYINEDARELRFSNKTTTDDHGIHLVGYKKGDNGKYWYLIKDSGAGSFDGNNPGYFFYHEDYIKLKIMDFMVHKDMVKDILEQL